MSEHVRNFRLAGVTYRLRGVGIERPEPVVWEWILHAAGQDLAAADKLLKDLDTDDIIFKVFAESISRNQSLVIFKEPASASNWMPLLLAIAAAATGAAVYWLLEKISC